MGRSLCRMPMISPSDVSEEISRQLGSVLRLTANEWKKARQFGDKFWLYVVTQAATDAPQLQRIQNPAAAFQIDEDIFATGFIVPEHKWRERANDGQNAWPIDGQDA